MTRGLPRTSFNSSRLIRLLADLAGTDVPEPKQSFAERLGNWLDLTDAISLHSALNPGQGKAAGASAPAVAGMPEELARVRSALEESITTDGVLKPGKARIKLPEPLPGASSESAADFVPYHRYYLAHQRDMASSIGQLRTKLRVALSGQSPALKRLAALDAVLDQALAVRERNLLATVPMLLARRFEQLHKAHQEALAASQAEDDPARWMQVGGWLAVFCRDMQGVLLAELDVRLQPVAGLMEALSNEVTKQQ